MQVETEDALLLKCRSQIETKLGWGGSDTWATQDFDALRAKILEATGTDLSVNTLKRIWGKIRYDSKPTLTTLNALANYLGHENWRVFQQSQFPVTTNGTEHKNGEAGKVSPRGVGTKRIAKNKVFLVALLGALIGFGAMSFFLFRSNEEKIDPQLFEFTSTKVVSEGVPNSVIFEYDATAAKPSDSVFIQQTWNPKFREPVSREQHLHTSIYYHPGLFQAKLVIGKQIAKEHNLFIKTTGWLPMVEQAPVPVYFNESDIRQSGFLGLPIEKLKANTISLQPVTPWTSYYNVKDFADLKSDDFVFETEVKNDYKEGAGACQHTEIHLLFEGGALVVPLSIRGCVSELKLLRLDGKKNDLSVLGCDFSDWAKVVVQAKDGKGEILVNGKQAYKISSMIVPPVRVIGVLYRFQGTGSVNRVKLSKYDGEIIYEDDF